MCGTSTFTSMTNDLDNLDKTVSSQGTRLSVVEGNISSKVWQQDIDSAIDDVEGDITTLSTKQTSLEQNVNNISATVSSHTTQIAGKADSGAVTAVDNKVSALELSLEGFKTTVGNTYAEKDDVDDLTDRVSTAESNIQQNANSISLTVEKVESLDVGGRNLLRKSDASKWIEEWVGYNESSLTLMDDRWVEVDRTTGTQLGVYPPCISSFVEAGEYVLSFEAYLSTGSMAFNKYCVYVVNDAGNMSQFGESTDSFDIDSTPRRYRMRLTTDESYDGQYSICIRAPIKQLYIRDIMLEKGNLASDWSPAPEDIDENIDNVRSELTSKVDTSHTDILQTSEQIILSALESYVETSDYGSFKSTVEAQLIALANSIEMNFTTTSSQLNGFDDELQSNFSELRKYIKFSGDNAISIGSSDSKITLEIDNENGIVFKKNNVPFGRWDGNNFHTGNIVVNVEERAQFGNFAFLPRNDGSLMLLKVGG